MSSVGWYRNWRDAFDEAQLRAWATRRRYRVWFEPNNRWWNLTETHETIDRDPRGAA